MEFLSVSLQVSEPQDESTARRCYCPSDTARSVKVNPLRWLGGSPLTVLKTPRVGTKITSGTSTSCSQLFTVRASLGSSAPLLSPLLSWRTQVSSSSHSTFHFSLPLPPPQPLGMCRLYDSREIQRGGGGFGFKRRPLLCASRTVCVIFLVYALSRREGSSAVIPKARREATQTHGTVCAPVPRSEATPLRSKF